MRITHESTFFVGWNRSLQTPDPGDAPGYEQTVARLFVFGTYWEGRFFAGFIKMME
jgi:hypothetical protein